MDKVELRGEYVTNLSHIIDQKRLCWAYPSKFALLNDREGLLGQLARRLTGWCGDIREPYPQALYCLCSLFYSSPLLLRQWHRRQHPLQVVFGL